MRLMRRPFGPLAGLLLAFFGLWLLAGSVHAQTSLVAGVGRSCDLLPGALAGRSSRRSWADSAPATWAAAPARSTASRAARLGGGQSTRRSMQECQQEMAVAPAALREEEQQPLIPVLKGGDWVIIQIGFHLPPRPVNRRPRRRCSRLYYGSGAAAPSPRRTCRRCRRCRAVRRASVRGGSRAGVHAALRLAAAI